MSMLNCPWCGHKLAPAGGSAQCCGRVFHPCNPANPQCVRAPNGHYYALGAQPGPLLCPYCRPDRDAFLRRAMGAEPSPPDAWRAV